MVDILERPARDFKDAAAPQAKVTLEIDADIAEYLKTQFPDFPDWQRHANDALRFYMDSSQQQEPDHMEPTAQDAPPPTIS
jgi:uncharacterized protein (DUF4415 family)